MQRLKLVVLVCIALTLVASLVDKVFGEDPANVARELLANDLLRLAKRAQEYYHCPSNENGGGGSFVGLTADMVGIEKLCFPGTSISSSNGLFIISTGGFSTSVVLTGTGQFKGTNGSPIVITAAVFPDSVYLTYQN